MRKFLPLFLLFLLHTSFFWEDEEKQLRQLHQKAEAALQEEKLDVAKDAYEELLKKVTLSSFPKYHLNWETYIDMNVRLSEIYESLDEREKAKQLLSDLLALHPPSEYVPRIKLVLAHLIEPGKAYALLSGVAKKLPVAYWKKNDLSFLHALEHSLNSHYDALVKKAHCHFIAQQFEEAATRYQELFEAIENGYYPKVVNASCLIAKKIKYRLAECYYKQTLYEKSLNILTLSSPEKTKIDREMIYLAALCYREKAEYEKALALFEDYAASTRQDLDHYEHALFEIGYSYFRSQHYDKALPYFLRLHNKKEKKGKPFLVGALYLAKIYLHQHDAAEVETILAPLQRCFSAVDPLLGELFYLRGQAAFQLENFTEGRDYFERSLKTKESSSWKKHALYHLGWCHLKLGELAQSEAIFNRLMNGITPDDPFYEKGILALAHLTDVQARDLPWAQRMEKLDTLYARAKDGFSLAGKCEILLLKAQTADDFSEREKIYSELTEVCDPSCAKGWYLRAINYFQEGLTDQARRPFLLERALTAFEKAFYLLGGKQAGDLPSLAKLLESNEGEGEEVQYLKGIIAIHLENELETEKCFSQLLERYPNGKYASHSLYLLGTLYFRKGEFKKAKDSFAQLTAQFPTSSQAEEGLYWCAEAAEKADEEAASLRYKFCTKYSFSPRTPEVYFKIFPFFEYSSGDPKALWHLKEFTRKFENSPLLVVAQCLLGIHAKHPEEAKIAFDAAIQAYCTNKMDTYVNFYYLARLKLAQFYLTAGSDLERCQLLLLALIKELTDDSHFLYSSLLQECEFTLARCYLKLGNEVQAERVFATMLEHFDKAGIDTGYYLSQVWHERGKLALNCKDCSTALQCFAIAEECGKEMLSDEEKLSLWISESHCYREKGELERAMRLLSNVINADVASSLRLEAMYLRAEIYQMQGRPELAMRQLEAAAKRGGRKND